MFAKRKLAAMQANNEWSKSTQKQRARFGHSITSIFRASRLAQFVDRMLQTIRVDAAAKLPVVAGPEPLTRTNAPMANESDGLSRRRQL